MSIGTDPTLDFLRSFDADPSKWVIVENVPVCRPHIRKGKLPDGTEYQIEVTEADLPDICAELNRRETEGGLLPILTIGHRNQLAAGKDEINQPAIVGYGRQYHVGKFGPKQISAVLVNEYHLSERHELAREFPFRSMDFRPGTKTVTGVALLKKDPWLELGMVTYDDSDGADSPQDGVDMTPVTTKNFAEYADKHLDSKPAWGYCMKQYSAAYPSGTNTAMPADTEKETVTMQADQVTAQYQALEARVKVMEQADTLKDNKLSSLEKANAELLSQINHQDAVTVVYELQSAGVKKLADKKFAGDFVTKLAAMTKAEREAYKAEVKDSWEKDATLVYQMAGAPVGGFVDVHREKVETTKPGMSDDKAEKVYEHIRANPGVTYEAAVAAINSAK